MNTLHKTFLSVIVLGSTLAGSGAHAEGLRINTAISNVSFGVVDLTPADGVAASYSSQFIESTFWLTTRQAHVATQEIRETVQDLVPASYGLNVGPTTISATADGEIGGISATATAFHNLGYEGYIDTRAYEDFTITLAAHSAFTVSGHAVVDIAYVDDLDYGQTGWGIAGIDLFRPGHYPEKEFTLATYNAVGYKAKDFSLYYENNTDQAITLTASFAAVGNSTTIASPVPEPHTYAMLGMGLLAVGAAARRRA